MLVTWALLLVSGCGSATSVTGKVTYEGNAVADGWVTFLPADGMGQEAGAKITAGVYRVESIDPGEKTVQIIGVKEVPFVASSEEMERLSRERPEIAAGSDLVHVADDIPPDAEGNHQKVTIQKGNQTMDFNLKKPATVP